MPLNRKNLFFKFEGAPDLDQGCMYRLKDGHASVIQPVGNNFDNRHQLPYILLDKNDRSGERATGRVLAIYKPELLDFIIIFAFIYEGAKNFTTVNSRVTVTDQKGNEVYCRTMGVNTLDTTYFYRTGSFFELADCKIL